MVVVAVSNRGEEPTEGGLEVLNPQSPRSGNRPWFQESRSGRCITFSPSGDRALFGGNEISNPKCGQKTNSGTVPSSGAPAVPDVLQVLRPPTPSPVVQLIRLHPLRFVCLFVPHITRIPGDIYRFLGGNPALNPERGRYSSLGRRRGEDSASESIEFYCWGKPGNSVIPHFPPTTYATPNRRDR